MSDIGDSEAYFFLGYSHAPKLVDHDETDPDVWAAKLYKDLCDHLFQISSLPLGNKVGFMAVAVGPRRLERAGQECGVHRSGAGA
jgi:hypothetical protein